MATFHEYGKTRVLKYPERVSKLHTDMSPNCRPPLSDTVRDRHTPRDLTDVGNLRNKIDRKPNKLQNTRVKVEIPRQPEGGG